MHYPKFVLFLVLWYFFSFATLFLNKYVLSSLNGDPFMLGSFQMLMCSFCGFLHVNYFSSEKDAQTNRNKEEHVFTHILKSKNLLMVGSLRYTTLFLGLIALWYVEVSFAETVKSSAPLFTVLISRLVLHERTNLISNLSLIPIMLGLALCTCYELNFTMIGFVASLLTNLSECFQNVYSKKLIAVDKYEPREIQYYTGLASLFVQLIVIVTFVDLPLFWRFITTDSNFLLAYLLDGISFHLQSLTEYYLLTQITSVTHSVANTCKRAFLIWLSVIIFGNEVTILSWIGTMMIIIGVLIFNKYRHVETNRGALLRMKSEELKI